MELESIFPELTQIESDEIREKTKAAVEDAVKDSGWKSIADVPYIDSWKAEAYPESLVEHTRLVTKIAIAIGKEMGAMGYNINLDELISAAILHDMGLLLEFEPSQRGVKQRWGRRLIRHPFFSMWLALKNGLPMNIAHAISAHSKEGEYTERTPEAMILYHADWAVYHIVTSKKR